MWLCREITAMASHFAGHDSCSLTSRGIMDVRGGFIVGIFNYCDRWCEACAFTSRCRLFADVAETEASLDPNLKAIVQAPVLPHEAPPPPPPWMEEMIRDLNEAATKVAVGEDDERPRRAPPEEQLAIEARARDYCVRVHRWLRARSYTALDPGDPFAVIGWFETMIPAKVHRAIQGLAEDWPEERDWPPDHDGSAKVALIGIERSHAAWLELVELGRAVHSEVAPFIADLLWLTDALERLFPKARAFVRPGFDEPDEVAMLFVRERQAG
jgi:hypothetical protein